MSATLVRTTLQQRYEAEFAGSRRRFEQARAIFPDGVTHDSRRLEPFPVYITHARGSKKWDVDGHELIDFWNGHGALLLGTWQGIYLCEHRNHGGARTLVATLHGQANA